MMQKFSIVFLIKEIENVEIVIIEIEKLCMHVGNQKRMCEKYNERNKSQKKNLWKKLCGFFDFLPPPSGNWDTVSV